MATNRGHVFITGISAGIGKSLAKVAVQNGWQVSGCSRRQVEIPGCLCVQADVCDAASVQAAISQAVREHGPLSVVVANAGRGQNGSIAELTTAELQSVWQVNLGGVHHTVQAAMPHMREGGCIQIVSSIVAWLPVPYMAAYCSSKHAVQAYAEALRLELDHIDVVTVNPGTIATDFFDTADQQGGTAWRYRPSAPLQPDVVAAAMFHQWATRKARIIMPFSAKLSVFLYKNFPRLAWWFIKRQRKNEDAQR